MPLYEYVCESCQSEFEALVNNGDEVTCPHCEGTQLRRNLEFAGSPGEQVGVNAAGWVRRSEPAALRSTRLPPAREVAAVIAECGMAARARLLRSPTLESMVVCRQVSNRNSSAVAVGIGTSPRRQRSSNCCTAGVPSAVWYLADSAPWASRSNSRPWSGPGGGVGKPR